MKSNLKKSKFNRNDKLAESKPEAKEETQKHYLELVPYEKADIARKNKFKFDVTYKKW